MKHDIVWDLETYPNVFTMAVEHAHAPLRFCFEVSPWRDDSREIVAFVQLVNDLGGRLVGFNSLGFDYPVLHHLLRMGKGDAGVLYQKAMAIIGSQDDAEGDRWLHSVKPTDRIVPQVDLYKIHHFDNKSRATGLKALEFNLRMGDVSDLPFPVGTMLTQEQVAVLKHYNAHDVTATKQFYHQTLEMIRFREELCIKYPDKDWINFNDTKIGKEYFTLRLEQAGVQCYEYGPNGRQPRQTKRPSIALRDAILPWIAFERPEFQRVLDWLREQTITETRGVFKDLVATVNGLDVVFGLGGIHGSVENEILHSDDEMVIMDIDVESYYPSTAIAQRFRPEHFPESFCDIYADLKEQRKAHKKGSAENAMLKLALNGVYGDSNNQFSVFYDPLMTMRITLNGQLLLCLLSENLLKIDGLRVIQMNTDGMTVRLPRRAMDQMRQIVQWWEGITKLKMEYVEYRRMFIRDVNSYIAEKVNGDVKRKGAYEWDREWHQDHSALVVPKVAEQVLLHGAPIRQTVEQWSDLYDFMLRVKVPRTSYLMGERGNEQERLPNTTRYIITRDGVRLFKWMPPLKGKADWRKIGVESGWNVTVCNDAGRAVREAVEHDYYIREIEKLCNILN